MPDPISVPATMLRTNLAHYLQQASDGGIVYILSHGYRIAAIVSRTDAENIEDLKRSAKDRSTGGLDQCAVLQGGPSVRRGRQSLDDQVRNPPTHAAPAATHQPPPQ
jgi:prevent-host-death family protein